MSNLRWLDVLVICLYLGLMAGMGWWFSRRQTTTERYYVGQRSIPGWAMGISMFATIISSITFIQYPGSAYAGNWNEQVPGFMVLVVLVLAGTIVIPFFRHSVGMSAYEYFGHRFGYGARAYAALAFIAVTFSKMGSVFYAIGLTVSSMTGWNIYMILIVVALVTILYTVMGGLEAVIWTEVVQGIVKIIGAVVILGVLISIMPGGVGAAIDLANKNDKFSLGTFSWDLSQKNSFVVMSLYGFFWYIQKYCADQTVVQRYLVAKSDREALKGVALGSILCVPVWAVFMLIGTLVWAYYQLSHESLPPHLYDAAGKLTTDKVYPYFVTTHVPAGLAGLFLAALFSAGMSTLASDLNCISAVGVEDYYLKLRPNAPDSRQLAIGKIIIALCGLISAGIAMFIAWKSDRALSLYYAIASISSGGLAGIFLLAFFSRRANWQGLWIGIAANFIFITWATLTSGKTIILDLHNYNFTWPTVMIGVIGHVIVLVVGFCASWFFPPDARLKNEWTFWGWLEKRKYFDATPASATPAGGPSP